MQEYQEALVTHGSQRKAAAALGMSRSKFQHRLRKERAGQVVLPGFPSPYVPVETLIERKVSDFQHRHRALKVADWYDVAIKSDKPIGIVWFGDPHVDDNGCNWPLLQRDIELCKATPGLHAANVGDVTNNWSGRLATLFSKQDSSQTTARALAEWFLTDSGVNWLLHVIGNHDAWGDGIEILKRMNSHAVPMMDWKARFTLSFPNGTKIKVAAAHDFPGHSMWNKTHGPARAAQMGGDNADLYVCGHKHTWGVQQFEMPDGRCPLILRARGYKWHDEYAQRLGFADDTCGASMMTIIDPNASSKAAQIMPFVDIRTGAKVLEAMRG